MRLPENWLPRLFIATALVSGFGFIGYGFYRTCTRLKNHPAPVKSIPVEFKVKPQPDEPEGTIIKIQE